MVLDYINYLAVLLFIYFFTTIFKTSICLWIVFIIWYALSMVISSSLIPGLKFTKSSSKSVGTGEKINNIAVDDCTSTLSDVPTPLDGMKVTIYSAALKSPSPNTNEANNIRSFSLKGITNKTEANSMYVETRRFDDKPITGYDTALEACNSNNKAAASYVTKSHDSSDVVTSENTTARVHYFHGGGYLFEADTYRVDAYVKDLAGKWHLVDRVSNIVVTE